MATPEMQDNSIISEMPTVSAGSTLAPGVVPDATSAGTDDWFSEFQRVEKVFLVMSAIALAGMGVAYLGWRIGNDAIALAGVIALSIGMVGMATMAYPVVGICVKAFRAWRRERAAKRGDKV